MRHEPPEMGDDDEYDTTYVESALLAGGISTTVLMLGHLYFGHLLAKAHPDSMRSMPLLSWRFAIGLQDAVDLNQEVEITIGVNTLSRCHRSCLLHLYEVYLRAC